MPVIPNGRPVGFAVHNVQEKLEDCPTCGKSLVLEEYDFQVCPCGWQAWQSRKGLASLMRSCVEEIKKNRKAKEAGRNG